MALLTAQTLIEYLSKLPADTPIMVDGDDHSYRCATPAMINVAGQSPAAGRGSAKRGIYYEPGEEGEPTFKAVLIW